MKTSVVFSKKQLELVDCNAEANRISRDEVIRRAVQAYLRGQKKKCRFDDHPAFGSSSKKIDSVAQIQKLRGEWVAN